MRIHVQNLSGMLGEPITRAEWQQAVSRAGLADNRHELSIGETLDDFAREMTEAEALVTATGITRKLFPD